MDFIHGQRWYEICDCVIDNGVDAHTKNVFDICEGLENIYIKSCIIFSKCDYFGYIFPKIQESKYNHVLISNNSDNPITEDVYNSKPSNIKWWFAQNVACSHDDLIPIPIGLERPLGGGISADYASITHNMNIEKNKLLYMNHNDSNNFNVRHRITEHFKAQSWCTHESSVSFQEYLNHMSQHKFVLSPYGNGIDCHRTWEALYLGVIPIVNSSIIADVVNEYLPIIIIDDMTTITEEYLNTAYSNIINKLYNFDILKFEWWKTQIINKFESMVM